jgi:hypothetical protein
MKNASILHSHERRILLFEFLFPSGSGSWVIQSRRIIEMYIARLRLQISVHRRNDVQLRDFLLIIPSARIPVLQYISRTAKNWKVWFALLYTWLKSGIAPLIRMRSPTTSPV